MRASDRNWERFGQVDPYFSVLTSERFRNAAAPGEERTEFFQTGEDYVARLFHIIHQRIEPAFTPTLALDFGCGVGRVTIPLARLATHVVGLDVSNSMLAEAARNCTENGLTNVQLMVSDDELSQLTGHYDLIHSYNTFQHIRPIRGERILRRLLQHLHPGGVGAIHVTCGSTNSRWEIVKRRIRERVPYVSNVTNLVRRRPWSYPLMEMNLYNLSHIFELFAESNCRELTTYLSEHGGVNGALLIFRRDSESSGRSWP
jgi:SAM-dependent methyltransferase